MPRLNQPMLHSLATETNSNAYRFLFFGYGKSSPRHQCGVGPMLGQHAAVDVRMKLTPALDRVRTAFKAHGGKVGHTHGMTIV